MRPNQLGCDIPPVRIYWKKGTTMKSFFLEQKLYSEEKDAWAYLSFIWNGIFPNCASLLNFLTCLCSSILEGTSAPTGWFGGSWWDPGSKTPIVSIQLLCGSVFTGHWRSWQGEMSDKGKREAGRAIAINVSLSLLLDATALNRKITIDNCPKSSDFHPICVSWTW